MIGKINIFKLLAFLNIHKILIININIEVVKNILVLMVLNFLVFLQVLTNIIIEITF